jgi:hypothetical protein
MEIEVFGRLSDNELIAKIDFHNCEVAIAKRQHDLVMAFAEFSVRVLDIIGNQFPLKMGWVGADSDRVTEPSPIIDRHMERVSDYVLEWIDDFFAEIEIWRNWYRHRTETPGWWSSFRLDQLAEEFPESVVRIAKVLVDILKNFHLFPVKNSASPVLEEGQLKCFKLIPEIIVDDSLADQR